MCPIPNGFWYLVHNISFPPTVMPLSEVDGGIFENLLWTNKFVTWTINIRNSTYFSYQ
jgi:hypothetical protein